MPPLENTKIELAPFRGQIIQNNIRVILFPKSTSAIYSTGLQVNRAKVITPWSLPTPNCSDDEGSNLTKSGYARTQLAISLSQSIDNEKFTFGTSSSSDVVLGHPHSSGDENCYINHSHLLLYP